MNENKERVIVISPLNLRHRNFIVNLETNNFEVAGVIVDKSSLRINLRSHLSLSGILNLLLSIFEFVKLGRLSLENIPIFEVSSLADPKISKITKDLSPTIIIVYGGKIIPKATLESLFSPCINVHGSILPGYRGLDSYWWSILENNRNLRGYSIHLVDCGIDTGNLLSVKRYSPHYKSLLQHIDWRIWISEDSAREIAKIFRNGKRNLAGTPHSKADSIYRSKIRFMDILRLIGPYVFGSRD